MKWANGLLVTSQEMKYKLTDENSSHSIPIIHLSLIQMQCSTYEVVKELNEST